MHNDAVLEFARVDPDRRAIECRIVQVQKQVQNTFYNIFIFILLYMCAYYVFVCIYIYVYLFLYVYDLFKHVESKLSATYNDSIASSSLSSSTTTTTTTTILFNQSIAMTRNKIRRLRQELEMAAIWKVPTENRTSNEYLDEASMFALQIIFAGANQISQTQIQQQLQFKSSDLSLAISSQIFDMLKSNSMTQGHINRLFLYYFRYQKYVIPNDQVIYEVTKS